MEAESERDSAVTRGVYVTGAGHEAALRAVAQEPAADGFGRVGAIVFASGAGENAAAVRRAALAGLDGLGTTVDEQLNDAPGGTPRPISPQYARAAVAVVPADEELEITTQTFALVSR